MRITEATITVTGLETAASYYAETLGLPLRVDGDGGSGGGGLVTVQLGESTLVLQEGPEFPGDHHLAFEVAPEDFDLTLAFARRRLSPISVDGDHVIVGPEGWNSRSVYWRGPEGIVLEYIAREVHRGGREPTSGDGPPPVLRLSEVGIGVDDVPATVARLGETWGLPPFPPQSGDFAPVGDHDGLLILVAPDRTWFPTRDASAARGALEVALQGPADPSADLPADRIELSPTTTLCRSEALRSSS